MMLAIASTGTLSLLDSAVLKRPPSSISPCVSVINVPTSSAWSHDNHTLFLSSSRTIHQYEPSSNLLRDIHTSTDEETISNLTCLSRDTLIYSVGNKVVQLECGSPTKVSQIIETQFSSITSLSISNDCSLLAITSCDAVHLHNIALGTHVTLNGLTPGGHDITASTFHPHSLKKLLLASGKKLFVYDTTRPAGPLKTIALTEATRGHVVGISCSPFSKSLVALARSSGSVDLIDLDKEKGLFRSLDVKASLTTIGFSSDGAALYLGTENGKLLILDLRALDKPPKSITISDAGCRVETMSVQMKVKDKQPSAQSKPSTTVSRKSGMPVTAQKPITNTARPNPVISPVRRGSPGKSTPQKVLTPVRDPLRNVSSNTPASELDTRRASQKKATPTKLDQKLLPRSRSASSPKVSISPKSLSSTSASKSTRGSPLGVTDRPKRARAILSSRKTASSGPESASATGSSRLTVPAEKPSLRTRASSSASRSNFDATPISSISTAASHLSSSSVRLASPQIVPSLPLHPSRTSSPTLSDTNSTTLEPQEKNPIRTIRDFNKDGVQRTSGTDKDNVKVDRKGKGKTVGFRDGGISGSEDPDRRQSMTMQVSPRRPQPISWEASPARQFLPGMNPDVGTSAHDLLRSIVKDAMYDFQRETRTEMTGLHLDLLRMGRGWKQEMKELAQTCAGAVNELREENRRLREENERLRGL